MRSLMKRKALKIVVLAAFLLVGAVMVNSIKGQNQNADFLFYQTLLSHVNIPTNQPISTKADLIWGDKIVNSSETYTDIEILLNGNLTIANGGSLTLTNVLLIVNCTFKGSNHIEVQSGGALYINDTDGNPDTCDDASIIKAYDSRYHFLFWVNSGSTFQMNNSELQNCGYNDYAIADDLYNFGIWINTNHTVIENNTFSNNYIGIVLQYAHHNTIRNNNATNNEDDGFELHYSSNNNVTGNTVTNSYFGFRLRRSSNNIVSGNTATNNYYGFYLEYSSNNNLLVGNTVSSNWAGFDLYKSSNNTLSDNTAIDNSGDGFRLLSSEYNNLSDNMAINNGQCGFYLEYCSYNTLSDNTAIDNSGPGFNPEHCSHTTFSNNTAKNNGNSGFYLWDSSYNIFSGNTAKNNRKTGFYLSSVSINNNLSGNTAIKNENGFFLGYDSNNNTFSGNTAINNNGYGFYIYSSSFNNLSDNIATNNTYGFYLVENSASNDLTGSIVMNYLRVEVLYYRSSTIQGAEVKVEVDGNVVYASLGFGGTNSSTNENGLTNWILVPYEIYISGTTAVENTTRVTVSFFELTVLNNRREVDMSSPHIETFIVFGVDTSLTTEIGAGLNQQVNASTQLDIELSLNLTSSVSLSIIKTVENYGGDTPFNLLFLGRFFFIEVNDTTAIQGITITTHYTDQEVSGINLNENSLAIWYWNETSGSWIQLPSTVDTQNNTVTAYTNHLTHFAILGTPIPPGTPETPISSYLPFLLFFLLTPSGLNPLIYLALGLIVVAILTVAGLGLGRRKAEIPEQEIVLELMRTPTPRKPKCIYCGSEIPEDAKFCTLCGRVIEMCSVCNREIVSGDRFTKCPYCGVISHRDHLLEWIKVKGYCPNCKERLSQEDII